jgi:LPS O-antigen subunit length determinant protein (WzzB/FepE family)
MRFLQLEWHNHERARNAWDIERAEMKAKIAKQEGEVRSARKLNDQLNKHIRMLEQALTNERKKKAETAGEDSQAATDDKKDSKGKKSGMNSTKRAYTTIKICLGYRLTSAHSPEQETQLLPRRGLGIPRPLRGRPR